MTMSQKVIKAKAHDKLYIVRKLVMARSVAEAVKKSHNLPVHEVYVDDEWMKGNKERLEAAIGFSIETEWRNPNS